MKPRPFRMKLEAGGVVELGLYGDQWFLTIEDETGRADGQIVLTEREAAALSHQRAEGGV